MTLWNSVLKTLKENGKAWSDIKFVTSRKEYFYYDDSENKFNIPLDVFELYSKQVLISHTSFNIKLVGDNFWLESDTDTNRMQRLDYYKMPRRANNEINLAKELLLDEEQDPLIILGLAIDYKEQIE